jgi:hypothetical protein
MFGNDGNKWEFDSEEIKAQIEFGQCFLPFSLEPFVFSPGAWKRKN